MITRLNKPTFGTVPPKKFVTLLMAMPKQTHYNVFNERKIEKTK